MAKLVLFDIDGTLVNTSEVDAMCYVRSFIEEFGLKEIDERWENYRHATDSGILDEIFERAYSRLPSEEEVERHIRRFLQLHLLVTAEALPVVGAEQARLVQVGISSARSVTALAQRRLLSDRALVMTALANGVFMPVELRGHAAVIDVLAQLVDDLPMRHDRRFILLRQDADRDLLRNVVGGETEPDIGPFRSEIVHRAVARRFALQRRRQGTGMAYVAAVLGKASLFHQGMAARALGGAQEADAGPPQPIVGRLADR